LNALQAPLIILLMLVPYILLTLRSLGYLSGLGPNPVETIIHGTGLWGIRFLMLTLLVTPIAYYTGIRTIAKLGKPVGLMAFFYVLNHFLSYAMIDQAGDIGVIIIDIIETPYLIVGWGGFLCLFGVASVSFKRLENWFSQNRSTISGLVYTASILGVWHFYWQAKVVDFESLIYSIILTVLIVWRFRVTTNRKQ
jgi:sulfoxide reductase heme-binding subunit YedZ|tara:strand:- start:7644 stop:8228 length:585 start_codon:yes stop_codon:yes gene_type:complete